MSELLESLGLGPVLLYLGMAWGTLLSLLNVIWELVKYIVMVLMEELGDVAFDGYEWETMSDLGR